MFSRRGFFTRCLQSAAVAAAANWAPWTLRRVEVPAPKVVQPSLLYVEPSDTFDFAREPSILFVGVTGDMSVRLPNGKDILFTGIPAGTFLPVRAARVNATGTTATGILAVY